MSHVANENLFGPGTAFSKGDVVGEYYIKADKDSPLGKWIAKALKAGQITKQAKPGAAKEKS